MAYSRGSTECRGTRLAAAWFLFLTLTFYSPWWLGGRHFLPADFLFRTPPWYDAGVPLRNFDLFDEIIYYYPNDVLLNEGVKHGHIPGWSPYNFCGHSLLANGQTGFLYPPRLLAHVLLPPAAAHDLLLVLHTFLAGLGMYLFARQLDLSVAASLLSGTAWMFNGNTLAWLEMEFAPVCTALIPWALYALEKSRLHRAWFAAAAALNGGLVLSGHLQFVFYSLAIIALMGGYRAWTSSQRAVGFGRLVLFLTAGFLLATPMLLAAMDALKASQRPTISLAYLTDTFRQFLLYLPPTLLAPDSLGTPVEDFALVRVPQGGNWIYPELCLYVGIAPLLLSFVGATAARRAGLARFLVCLALLTLLVPATPLYWFVCLLPGLSNVIATRAIYLVTFAAVLLAGIGLDILLGGSADVAKRVGKGVAMVAITWVGAMLVIHSIPLTDAVRYLLTTHRLRLPERQLFVDPVAYHAAVVDGFQRVYGWTSPCVLLPFLWLGIFALILSRWRRSTALVLLTAADLMVFGWRFNPTVPADLVYPETSPIQFLDRRAGLDRVMGIGTIKPNTLSPFRVQDIGGYDSFYPRDAAETLFYVQNRRLPFPGEILPAQMFPLTRYDSGLVNLMGVRYFVTYPERKLTSAYPMVMASPLPIFENPRRLPRVFVAPRMRVVADRGKLLSQLDNADFDAMHEVLTEEAIPQINVPEPDSSFRYDASIVTYRDDDVRIEVNASAPGWLVLTDTYANGWTATINNMLTPILKVDAMFRAVRVGAGRSTVAYRYQPPGFLAGLWVAGLTSLGLLFLALPTKKRTVSHGLHEGEDALSHPTNRE